MERIGRLVLLIALSSASRPAVGQIIMRAAPLAPAEPNPAAIAGDKPLPAGDKVGAMLEAVGAAVVKAVKPPPPDPAAQNIDRQMRPYLRAELYRLGKVCTLTDAQRDALAAAAEVAFRAQLRTLSVQPRQSQAVSKQPDPYVLVQQLLLEAAREDLPPAEFARYKAEFEREAEDRKRVTILNLVALLDEELHLNASQRDELRSALEENWSDDWDRMELFRYGLRFFPQLPEKVVEPVLSFSQRALWRNLRGQQSTLFGVLGNGLDNPELDPAPADDAAQGP